MFSFDKIMTFVYMCGNGYFGGRGDFGMYGLPWLLDSMNLYLKPI